ncbi:MAG: hypothetical protein K2X86_17685 [Cytophagaceae bacterium]|nr:hypothetical protein [Cytophagaceae bacterium]
MRNYFFKAILPLTIFCVLSCKKKEHDPPGPSIPCIILPFQLSGTSVNFSAANLTMRAKFGQAKSWSIIIKGQTSGAIKTYSGTGDSVHIDWRGTPDSLPFFQDENVVIKFKSPCGDTITKSITISNPVNFNNHDGVSVSDFEGNGMVNNSFTYNGYNMTGWSSYYTSPAVITEFGLKTNPLLPLQGSTYMILKGTTGTSSFLGGAYGTINLGSLPSNDPDSIYFNMLVHNGGNTNTSLTATVGYSGQQYTKSISLIGNNWKVVNYKLSDFKNIYNNTISDTYMISYLDFGILTNTGGQSAEVNIDFIVFTYGAPLIGK